MRAQVSTIISIYAPFCCFAWCIHGFNIGSTSNTKRIVSKPEELQRQATLSRRESWKTAGAIASTLFPFAKPNAAFAQEEQTGVNEKYAFEKRNRNKNKDALVRDDVWYFSGQIPPRNIDLSNLPPGPKWNAWGTCSTDSSTGNSCTYVSLKQRIPAYSSYAFVISLGAREYTELGNKIKAFAKRNDPNATISNSDLSDLITYVNVGKEKNMPPPAIDAQLKMILLSTSLLTSPNYTGPPFELLIARFYVNELHFATREIASALIDNDIERAYEAWMFGRDSWNSYFSIVNKAIVPKVGDKFEFIA